MFNGTPEQRVTIREVGKLAGVSPATVGRVVGGYGQVSDETRQRVIAAIQSLDYYPNGIAQQMKGKQMRSIGMIVSDICNPFFSKIVRAVEDTLIKYGYNLIVCNTDDNIEKERIYIQTLSEKRVDGVLTCTASEIGHKVNPKIKKFYTSLPTVFIDRELVDIHVPVVQGDNYGGSYEAITHFIRLGHRKIATIAGGSKVSSIHQRINGYVQALTDHGISIDEDLIQIGNLLGIEGGVIATKFLLDLPESRRPTAILGLNNLMTTGAMLVIKERGLTIPDDIALISWDDFDLATLLSPPLTVVTQPTYSIGTIAAERLMDKLQNNHSDHKDKEMKIVLKTELIIRESCGYQKPSVMDDSLNHPGLRRE